MMLGSKTENNDFRKYSLKSIYHQSLYWTVGEYSEVWTVEWLDWNFLAKFPQFILMANEDLPLGQLCGPSHDARYPLKSIYHQNLYWTVSKYSEVWTIEWVDWNFLAKFPQFVMMANHDLPLGQLCAPSHDARFHFVPTKHYFTWHQFELGYHSSSLVSRSPWPASYLIIMADPVWFKTGSIYFLFKSGSHKEIQFNKHLNVSSYGVVLLFASGLVAIV